MYRIFLVEDDETIAGAVARHLEGWGYTVRCAQAFDRVLQEFAAFDPQLVLLDIALPFFNGYHWCQEIRRISNVPILFLTSAGDSVNTVMAMQLGGDDLLAKPFDLQVLSAKVQAMLRRAYDFGPPTQLLQCGGAVLNVSDGTLTAAGQRVELTRNEFRILQMPLNWIISYFPQSWKFLIFTLNSYFVDIRHRVQKCSMIQVVHRWIIPIE